MGCDNCTCVYCEDGVCGDCGRECEECNGLGYDEIIREDCECQEDSIDERRAEVKR